MKKYKHIFLLLLFSVITLAISAKTDSASVKTDSIVKKEKIGVLCFSGSVDTYYHNTLGTVEKAPKTSFANLPGFSLGMINIIIGYDTKKTGVIADLFYGPRGSDAAFNAPIHTNASGAGSAQIINQMYVYYKISQHIRFSLGQFNSFAGYELIAPTDNFHYSTSYLFSYGPTLHTGLLADLTLGKGWVCKISLMNPSDFTEFNPTGTYTLGGQLAHVSHTSSIYLNAIYGDQDGKLKDASPLSISSMGNVINFDLTSGWSISRKYFLGINTSYQEIGSGEVRTASRIERATNNKKGLYGIALYQKLTFTKDYALGLRAEYFKEFNGGVGAIGVYDAHKNGTIAEVTLSGNFISDNFRLIPEIRIDMSSGNAFTEKASGKPTSNMMSFNLAVVYSMHALSHPFYEKNKL
jgi:hypothetical protein